MRICKMYTNELILTPSLLDTARAHEKPWLKRDMSLMFSEMFNHKGQMPMSEYKIPRAQK